MNQTGLGFAYLKKITQNQWHKNQTVDFHVEEIKTIMKDDQLYQTKKVHRSHWRLSAKMS